MVSHRADSPHHRSKSTQSSSQHEYKQTQKAIESLEECLSSEFLTELERHNLEEAVKELKRSLEAR